MMKNHFRFLTAFSLLAAAPLLLTGCSEEQASTYSRIPEVPAAANTQASAAPAPGAGADASPHGANPHAGLSPAAMGATGATTAPAMAGGAGGPMSFAPPSNVQVRAGGNILEAAGVAFTIPEGWTKGEPANAFRLAQYSIPGEAGPAELVLFYFGKGQGGNVEQNVRRWAGQFKSDDPTTTTIGAEVGEFENGGLRVALVKTSGTYDPGSMGPMMGGAPAEPKKNWGLFGLVIEGGPEGSLFVKVTGPKATLDAQNKNLEAFAQSIRKSNFK